MGSRKTLSWGLNESETAFQCRALPACKGRSFVHDMKPPNDLDRKSNAKIMLVGDSPGKRESAVGRPFVEEKITSALKNAGLSRDDVYMTHVVKCRTTSVDKNGRVKKRAPRSSEIRQCLPLLEAEINAISPVVIVAMGETAIKTLAGEENVGKAIEKGMLEYKDILVIPTYHPGATSHDKTAMEMFEMRKQRENAFERASKVLIKKGRVLQL